jgi:hypothetical protein
MSRQGPTYVNDGYVIGHRQSKEMPGWVYSHQFEVIRPATLWERLMWMLFRKPPAA